MTVRPPNDPGETKDEAWKNGFQAAVSLARSRVAELADSLDAPDDGGETGECEECGSQMIKALGGPVCPECGNEVKR